jgi:hypothetical protein
MKTARVMAACHIHSVWSYDGVWPLEAIASKFSRRGYRILMMTEHDKGFTESRLLQYRDACAQASSDEMLVLPGIEYSDAANNVHVLVWGQVPFLGEGLSTSLILEGVAAAKGAAVLAHPSRQSANRQFDPAWSDYLNGIELWNRKFDGWSPSKKAPRLIRRAGAIPFVGMDFHGLRQMFPLSMALDLQDVVSEETVLNCIRLRRIHPCAFGFPVNGAFLGLILPFLFTAEHLRYTLAWIYRRLKTRNTRRPGISKISSCLTRCENGN